MNIDELVEKARLTDMEIAKFHWIYISPASIDTTKAILKAQREKVFSLVVKEAGICPECKGKGLHFPNTKLLDKCPTCHGTGRT